MTGGFDIKELIRSAKTMMEKAQVDLSSVTANGQSGAGLVDIVINARHEILSFKLADEIFKEEKSVIEDLICAAFNDACHKIFTAAQEEVLSGSGLFGNGNSKDEGDTV